MRKYYNDCKVDGKPILVPDRDIGYSAQDLDAEGSGRDELGFMHRIVLRNRVKKWQLKYASLTYDEFDYMCGLLEGKSEFVFDYTYADKRNVTKAYCSATNSSLRDAKKGTLKNVSFSIIEC